MIYTSITGGYDYPRDDVPVLTGYDKFKDDRLNAKIYKVLPHMFLPNEDWWIWIDGNLTLKVSEQDLINRAGNNDVCVFANPYRETVGEEMEEIVGLGLEKEVVVNWLPYPRELPLSACFLIIRRNTPTVVRQNEAWWAEICAGSARDQISFPYCFPNAVRWEKVHPFDNDYFTRRGHKCKTRVFRQQAEKQ
jgi:hypothetical protein